MTSRTSRTTVVSTGVYRRRVYRVCASSTAWMNDGSSTDLVMPAAVDTISSGEPAGASLLLPGSAAARSGPEQPAVLASSAANTTRQPRLTIERQRVEQLSEADM